LQITIKNWSKFQHYKDRKPSWIKLLIEIIDPFDADGLPKKFHAMPDSAKLTFILLACLRANYNKHIPYPSDKWLRERLGITTLNLQPLVDAGFITIDTDLIQNGTDLVQNDTDVFTTCTNSLPPELYTKEREVYTGEAYKPNSKEFVLSELLQNLILGRKPDFKKPNLQKWAIHIDRMIRLDNRKPETIEKVIRWCQTDDFWQNNILSTAKLRKQFDKLELRMGQCSSSPTKKTKLFPIPGKTCGKQGCPLPAVYKNTAGEYDSYYCVKHMPESVKELYV